MGCGQARDAVGRDARAVRNHRERPCLKGLTGREDSSRALMTGGSAADSRSWPIRLEAWLKLPIVGSAATFGQHQRTRFGRISTVESPLTIPAGTTLRQPCTGRARGDEVSSSCDSDHWQHPRKVTTRKRPGEGTISARLLPIPAARWFFTTEAADPRASEPHPAAWSEAHV
jgi:hypothetical protein